MPALPAAKAGKKKDRPARLSEFQIGPGSLPADLWRGSSPERVFSFSLNTYLDKWLEAAARPRVRTNTFTSYVDVLDLYVRPSLGEKRLSDVRPLDLQEMYSKMQTRGLSARTIRYAHTIFSSALEQAVKWRIAARNPAAQVELPRMIRKEMSALSPEEVARFLDAAKEDSLGILFAFALATGLRPSEFLALQWKDVDLNTGIITVRRTLHRSKGGGRYYGEPKTVRSRRNIPLPSSTLRALVEHKRRQAEARLRAGAHYRNNDLVFATGDGTPLLLRNIIRRNFRPVLRRAGFLKLCASTIYDTRARRYCLRQAYIQRWQASGQDIPA